MEILGRIKRLYSRDKKSLHEIARTTGLSCNTIRKWVRGTDEVDKPSYRRKETANKLTAFHQALILRMARENAGWGYDQCSVTKKLLFKKPINHPTACSSAPTQCRTVLPPIA